MNEKCLNIQVVKSWFETFSKTFLEIQNTTGTKEDSRFHKGDSIRRQHDTRTAWRNISVTWQQTVISSHASPIRMSSLTCSHLPVSSSHRCLSSLGRAAGEKIPVNRTFRRQVQNTAVGHHLVEVVPVSRGPLCCLCTCTVCFTFTCVCLFIVS